MIAEYEIDRAHEIIVDNAPEFAPYSKYLSDWRNIVNANSDGWPYWHAGAKAADKLGNLVKQAAESVYRSEVPAPDADEMKKAMSPIKAAATRHKLTAPEFDDAPARAATP